MRYYRLRVTDRQSALQEPAAGEAPFPDGDVWLNIPGMPFVVVTRKVWRPPTDIYETSAEVVIKMEIAGMNEDDLEIVIDGDLLAIRGRRLEESGRRKIGYHHMGITYGEFALDIKLPGPIAQDQVTAEYQAGFLKVTLPKLEPRTNAPLRISVTE